MSAAVNPWATSDPSPVDESELQAALRQARREARRRSTKPPTYTSLDEAGRKAALSDEKRAVEAWEQKEANRLG